MVSSLPALVVAVGLVTLSVRPGRGYPTGAGTEACSSQSPQVCHGGSPQTSPAPYSIVVEGDVYSPGKVLNVTLKVSQSNTTFKGFLLAAHRVSGDTAEYLGSFAPSPDAQPRCGQHGNSGVTHTNNSQKVSLTLQWTPPAIDGGDLVFESAVLFDHDTYWVNVTSDTVLKPSNYSGHVTSAPPPASTSPVQSDKFPKDSACGHTKSCYGDCQSDGCTIQVTWYVSGQSLVISITSVFTAGDNVWAAVGFGDHPKMNVASVQECVANGGEVQAFMSVNRDYSNTRLSSDVTKSVVSEVSGSLKDGVMTCTLHREMDVAAGPDVFNLTHTKYHVLLARGSASGWTKQPHSGSDAYVTPDSYSLNVVVDIGAHSASYPLVKLHGCLMTLAWVLAASIGVLAARFFKDTWPKREICGVHVWFAIHRMAMVVAFLATAAGFVIIFVHVKGYSQIMGTNFQKAHPVLGIIVTCLTVLNPIMSMFRCAPNHEHRPIFNWAHWFVGSSAYILGVLTVIIGTQLTVIQIPDHVTYVAAGFGGWHVLAHTLLEIIKCAENNETEATPYKNLQNFSVSREAEKVLITYHGYRRTIFVFHVLIALGACIGITVTIIGA